MVGTPARTRGDRERNDRSEPGGRDRLLAAAIECFSSRGYAGTGIAELCRSAGVAKTALYWHFENKEGLLAAVIEEVGIRWIESIQSATMQDGEPHLRVQRLVAEWRRVILEEPSLLRLLALAQLERGDLEPTRTALRTVWDRAEQALVDGIEEAIGIAIPDVDLIAHTVFVLLQGMIFRMIVDPDPEMLERLLGELQRTFVLLVADRLPSDFVYATEQRIEREPVGNERLLRRED